ncbi:LexA family protein [Sphingomonas sp. Leaf4]|uniref:LexA family protein n=1 Tax=Sphingomonas sp. Leaf4 TaxID=2876553 RepID=UPI001E56F272|nr:XRE family transcriptional regulator [Sphingomonas sp. Leaf4]
MEIEQIRHLMILRGYRQADLARRLGLAPNKITKAFKGERRFTAEEVDSIREWLAPSAAAQEPKLRAIPVIGQVAAGNWREAIQRASGAMPAPDASIPPNAFAIRVDGDSMDLLVEDGSMIVIDPDDRSLYPGRFYVILNEDGEATFKRFEADPARLVPCSSNERHQPIVIGSDDHFTVVGRVIWRAARM